MIEAVNSVLSTAPYTKAVVEQQSVATSYAANPDRVQQATSQAPYISLYIKVDTNFDKAILQIRDSDTGDVVRQIPTESQLEAYRRAQTSNSVRRSEAQEVSEVIVPETETRQVDIPDPVPVSTSAPATDTSAPAPAPAPAQTPAPVSIDTQA